MDTKATAAAPSTGAVARPHLDLVGLADRNPALAEAILASAPARYAPPRRTCPPPPPGPAVTGPTRPAHIPPALWERMPWLAQQKAALRALPVEAADEDPDTGPQQRAARTRTARAEAAQTARRAAVVAAHAETGSIRAAAAAAGTSYATARRDLHAAGVKLHRTGGRPLPDTGPCNCMGTVTEYRSGHRCARTRAASAAYSRARYVRAS